MLSTFEMRWFFSNCPLSIEEHFHDNTELQTRTDWYAFPCGPDCGIKLREGRLETKIRSQIGHPLTCDPLEGRTESFKKWSLLFPSDDAPQIEDLQTAGWLEVQKERRLKRFHVKPSQISPATERPSNGCEFELTKLTVQQGIFWTVGFEAVGPPEKQSDNLQTIVRHTLHHQTLKEAFTLERSMGYAEWLSQL